MVTFSLLRRITRTAGAERVEKLLLSGLRNDLLRDALLQRYERKLQRSLASHEFPGDLPPGVYRDRRLLGWAALKSVDRALREKLACPEVQRRIVHDVVTWSLVEGYHLEEKELYVQQHDGDRPPWFLVISPYKGCNLHCKGCYADSSASTPARLEWDVTDRLIQEAKTTWKTRFIVFSGGEPMAYRDGGRTILDLVEKHPDVIFMMYTNGTLIDDRIAERMARLGNLSPAISVEGMQARTDDRRGAGVFDRVVAAMRRLRGVGVPFGVSLTATRQNSDEILSDEFVDFFFDELGALYGWIFHYMPIGRSFTLELLPSPEQRVALLRRTWDLIRDRSLFLVDFWNSGPAAFGCLAAAKSGGYLYVDWDGNIMPCVFCPYTPVNLRNIYRQGRSLEDVRAEPFFAAIREWQKTYKADRGNWLLACPIRDHHAEFRRILRDCEPDPQDEAARQALLDPAYYEGMVRYGADLRELMDPIWEEEYVGR
jgi:MoaA/NifB/PqqE/SkfB family radical SAM enzyme